MAILEGRWDCSSCQTRGILGRYKACPKCGNPRDESEDVYLPSDATAVTDESLLELANAGIDWHCEHCGSDNRGDRVLCKNCGAARGTSPERSTEALTAPRSPSERRPQAAPTPAARSEADFGPLICGVLFVIAVLFGTFTLLKTHTEPLTVTSAPWVRTIGVDVYMTVREGGWSVPGGGRLVSKERRVHHHDQILIGHQSRSREVRVQTGTRTERYKSGVRNKGNGFYEEVYETRSIPVYGTRTEHYEVPIYRSEPRYQTWYEYDTERWVHARSVTAKGSGPPAKWPALNLGAKEREGGRSAEYRIVLSGSKGKSVDRNVPESQWEQYPVGAVAAGTYNSLRVLTRLDPPGPH